MASNRALLLTAAVLFISARWCIIIHNVQAFNVVAPVGTSSCNIHQYHAPTSVPTLSTSVPSSFSSSSIAISYIDISFTKQFKRRIKPKHTLLSAAATPDNDTISAPPTISPTSNNKHPNSNLNRNEQLFQKRIQQLNEFQKKYGHGSIPSPYKPNPSLGIWAANLRRQHALSLRAEETNRPYIGYLTSERYQTLIKEGFEFTSLTERQFQLRLVELQEFKDRFGHCNVPEKWDENFALGAWVSNIRSLYKRRRRIQQQQTNKEAVSKETPKKQKMIRRNRNILLHKVQSHKKKQKRSSRFSHLDDERIQLLESMGFVWSANDRKWYEMLEWCKVYGILSRYFDESTYDVYSNCGEIDSQQATADIKNELNHTLLLDNYHHFVGNIQNQSIVSTFHSQDEILSLFLDESYAQQNGEKQSPKYTLDESSLDYRISPNDTLHYPLRIWMINQRSNYNRLDRSSSSSESQQLPPFFSSSMIPSTMTQQRQEALESINFPWSGRFPNRIKEVQYEQEKLAEIERQEEKKRRIEEKERKERERVEQLTSRRDDVGMVNEPVDVMALWQAGDDEDDDDW